MTVVKHELNQSRVSTIVWTAGIASLIAVCVFLFPEMKGEMEGIGSLFAAMGSFTAAFGMDKVNFGSLTGFYSIECGNCLGIGGALFAALCGISVLAKEEKDHTAEFLLSHPVSRSRIITEKLLAVFIQIILLNAVVYAAGLGSIAMIGEKIPWKEMSLLHFAYFLLQIEIAGICFGISAFIRRGGMGIGLGLAMMLYFFHLFANISDRAEFLRYITPFGYADGTDIVSSGSLNGTMLAIGLIFTTAGIVAAYVKYTKKDIL